MAAERYNKGRKDWVLPRPDEVAIAESNIGWDKRNLYFPGVSTCIALVMVLDDGMLLGAHFDKMLSAEDVGNMLDRMLAKNLSQSTVNHLSVVGNMSYRDDAGSGFMSQPEFQGELLLLTLAKKFGVKGIVSSYDQGLDADKHYCAQSIDQGRMRLYYNDVTPENRNEVREKVVWHDQVPLTPLRQLY